MRPTERQARRHTPRRRGPRGPPSTAPGHAPPPCGRCDTRRPGALYISPRTRPAQRAQSGSARGPRPAAARGPPHEARCTNPACRRIGRHRPPPSHRQSASRAAAARARSRPGIWRRPAHALSADAAVALHRRRSIAASRPTATAAAAAARSSAAASGQAGPSRVQMARRRAGHGGGRREKDGK